MDNPDLFDLEEQELIKGIKIIEDPNERFKNCFTHSLPDGLVLEFGVYEGRTIKVIQETYNCKVYGFDSWQGLPEEDSSVPITAGFNKGAFTIAKHEILNVELIDGWYENTVPVFAKNHIDNIRFLHVDCDLYISTKQIFDGIGHLITHGTVIQFDEYKFFENWQHREYKVFKDFITRTGFKYEYLHASSNFERVALKIL